jgi:hypothetical protein
VCACCVHSVLVFSQMVRVLDILSDYMRLRGFQHQRLDGSTPAPARHQVRCADHVCMSVGLSAGTPPVQLHAGTALS